MTERNTKIEAGTSVVSRTLWEDQWGGYGRDNRRWSVRCTRCDKRVYGFGGGSRGMQRAKAAHRYLVHQEGVPDPFYLVMTESGWLP